MSLLDRWVANTKRVLAKDKNTGSEYEFESIFPDGAPDGTAFNSENMNKIIDAVNGLDESKGQPNGIATLTSSGKLAQMPTAADVGAASINIRQIDIKPLVPDNGGDLMCRCWINPWHEAHLMIRWSLRSPLTSIDFAELPDECLPIMALDAPCILRSPSYGLEPGIIAINWGGKISITRSSTSSNDTFTMISADINYHTYY